MSPHWHRPCLSGLVRDPIMHIEHPYTDLTGGSWLRGNLHAHSTNSDGSRAPQVVVDDYAGRGYDFLMLSDHDYLTAGEELAALAAGDMVLLAGNEISRHGPHMLHVGASGFVEPEADRQQVLDSVAGAGGFAVINHPNWFARFNHCDQQLLHDWQGYAGLEIYNGVIGRLEGSPYATDRWDMLLATGRRVWGFAHDDSHSDEDVELGWNRVYARERTAAAIIEAMQRGCFYASTGVEITEIAVDGDRIRVATANAQRIVALQRTAKRFAAVDDTSIEVTVPENAGYVRFECWGAGEQFAWTQPFWVGDA
jgi:hypothetical protein